MTPRRSASGARSAGEPGSGSLDLIHRTKVPNSMGMRVTARFEAEKGLPLECLTAPCPLSFLAGWRAGHGAKSTP